MKRVYIIKLNYNHMGSLYKISQSYSSNGRRVTPFSVTQTLQVVAYATNILIGEKDASYNHTMGPGKVFLR